MYSSVLLLFVIYPLPGMHSLLAIYQKKQLLTIYQGVQITYFIFQEQNWQIISQIVSISKV